METYFISYDPTSISTSASSSRSPDSGSSAIFLQNHLVDNFADPSQQLRSRRVCIIPALPAISRVFFCKTPVVSIHILLSSIPSPWLLGIAALSISSSCKKVECRILHDQLVLRHSLVQATCISRHIVFDAKISKYPKSLILSLAAMLRSCGASAQDFTRLSVQSSDSISCYKVRAVTV